jgi:hypothetical protein
MASYRRRMNGSRNLPCPALNHDHDLGSEFQSPETIRTPLAVTCLLLDVSLGRFPLCFGIKRALIREPSWPDGASFASRS